MKILITGGAGFIGSVLCHELAKSGSHEITLMDQLFDGEKWKNVRGLKYLDFLLPDQIDCDKIVRYNVIIHMGACSDTTEKNCDHLIRNNFQYSQQLFDWATHYKIRFIYASSAATYGAGEHGYNDDEALCDQLRPLNPYGYSKFLFDRWVLGQHRRPPAWFGLKFFNVYGPQEYHKAHMSSVIYHAYNQIVREGKIRLFKSTQAGLADGEQRRDFISVFDIARVVERLLTTSGEHSGIYNLGTGQARSFNDLANAIFKSLNLSPQIEYVDMPAHLMAQYQNFTEANMQKLERLLPDLHFTSLEDGVREYVQNYLANQRLYF